MNATTNLFRNPVAREFFGHHRWLATEAEMLLAPSVEFRGFWAELDQFLLRHREPFSSFADASHYFTGKWTAEDAAFEITIDRATATEGLSHG